MGLLVGLWEAGLLYFVPSVREFIVVDSTYVIWFLAPLVDVAFFGVLGAILGCFAIFGKPSPRRSLVLAAALIGCAGAHIGWANHFVYAQVVDPIVCARFKDILFPLIRFAVVCALALAVTHFWRGRILPWFSPEKRWPTRRAVAGMLIILLGLGGGVLFCSVFPPLRFSESHPSMMAPPKSPNIVLIIMDTVRADHLSAYGYDRNTTPNLDRMAAHGVLFENAIAATSWTLPSFASIFTGLLPHQSGANSFRVMNSGWATIGSVLEKHGYATAGFNANFSYGQAGWGLGHGFETYDDDPTSVRYNLARTLVGRALIQPLYQRFGPYNAFFRRDAGDLNADIFRWLRRPPSRPFYLCINYFDAHTPYQPPAPYNHRFGTLPEALERRWAVMGWLSPEAPVSAADRARLIDAYDNSLAYIDAQVGRLIRRLKASSSWKNTVVIVAADHGEAFGEHGAYQHACDLHREEIHVPLIIFGPGIPSGRRIVPAVPVRDLFATALDLALGSSVPMHPMSLARYWQTGFTPADAPPVISELSSSRAKGKQGEISLTTAQWHYILGLNGKQELYDWATDPGEKHDLSSSPQDQKTLETLHAELQEIESNSLEPWIGREYLFALGASPASSSSDSAAGKPPVPPSGRVGAAQAYFRPSISPGQEGPNESEKEILKSLPYQ